MAAGHNGLCSGKLTLTKTWDSALCGIVAKSLMSATGHYQSLSCRSATAAMAFALEVTVKLSFIRPARACSRAIFCSDVIDVAFNTGWNRVQYA
jgi:hypothetical protein